MTYNDGILLQQLQTNIHDMTDAMKMVKTPPQTHYVIEECAELTQAIIKNERGKGSKEQIVDEACDVLGTILTLLYQYKVSPETIVDKISDKCERAITRIHQEEKP